MENIKVYLVEDEIVIREGISKNIAWENYGLELCGDAPDGEMAWNEITIMRPDIVITDIRMPFLDGLELSKLIKDKFPETEIIILSGYEEFEYAKECIRIGVAEYILKPISREDLIVKVKNIADKIRKRKEEEDINEVEYEQMDRESVSEFLHFSKAEDVDDFVDTLLKKTEKSIKSQLFRQYITMDIYFATIKYLDDYGVGKEKQDELVIDISQISRTDTTIQCLKDLLKKACELKQTVKNTRNSQIVDKVIKYVEENYKDEDLSLNQVAEYLSFSPNHLSGVFHQEYGQSFVKYLTKFRMEKAKELLRKKGMKSGDVCYEVGYKDPHYFSSTFKKSVGMTPTQYREGKI